MEKGTQEQASSALTSSLETSGPSILQLSQGTHRHTMPSWVPFPTWRTNHVWWLAH